MTFFPSYEDLRRFSDIEAQRRREIMQLQNQVAHSEMTVNTLMSRVAQLEKEISEARHEAFALKTKLITQEGISEMRENMIEFYRKLLTPTSTVPNAGKSGPEP